MLEINELWYSEYKDKRPFDLEEIIKEGIPSPTELKEIVAAKSAEFKQKILLDGLVRIWFFNFQSLKPKGP